MGMIAGNNATLQVGAQSDFSTAVAPTVQVEFVSESLDEKHNLITPDQITGKRSVDRLDEAGIKVEGGVELVANPANIGILLAAAFGAEADPAAVDSSAVYDHVFTPMSAAAASSLPKLTMVVDRIQAVKGYVGCKINRMSLSAGVQDYLKAGFDFIGRNEATDALESLSSGEKRPFMFTDGNLQFNDTDYDEVLSLSVDFVNNLENDLYVLNGSNYMVEIEPQRREITAEVEALYSSDIETLRESYYKGGTKCSLEVTFTSTEEVLTGKYYTLTVNMPNCYITGNPVNVSGPDRIRTRISLTATEQNGESPITVTLRDGQATKHIA